MHDEVVVLGLTRRSKGKVPAAAGGSESYGFDDHLIPGGPADDRFLDPEVWSDDPSARPDHEFFGPDGADQHGFGPDGLDGQGFDRHGFDEHGFDEHGFDEHGFDEHGFDVDGYDRDGYHREDYGLIDDEHDGYDAEFYAIDDPMLSRREATGHDFFDVDGVAPGLWFDEASGPGRQALTSPRRPVRAALSLVAVLAIATVVGNSSGVSPQQTSASEATSEDATTRTTADTSAELSAAGNELRTTGLPATSTTLAEHDTQTDAAQPETGDQDLATSGESIDGGTPADGVEPAAPAEGSSAAAPEMPMPEHPTASGMSGDYASNLALIKNQTVRNRNQDASPYVATPSAQLDPNNHYGPRSEYLNNPGGNPEQAFPVEQGGQFRVGCEFSHFSYDDPLVFPNQPGAAHLHMYFGNTDVNAFSTADSVLNTGSSTCNGQELNRTAYWAPAMFDASGNVRIPERVVVYYKGEGLARTNAEPFPDGAAMISSANINTISPGAGGAAGKFNFVCSDNYSGASAPASNTMPSCDGNRFGGVGEPYSVLEMNVKFPQCWNGQDPSNPDNFRHPSEGGWYFSLCNGEFNRTFVNLEYFINYKVEPGESTEGWYLSSDVDPASGQLAMAAGSSIHADWWTGWHKQTNQMFLDNCVKYKNATRSGCGFGYLTDGGPNGESPASGPALKYRAQFTGPTKVPASQLFAELCPGKPAPASPSAAAYCHPGGHPDGH